MQVHGWFSWEGQKVCISVFSWTRVTAVSFGQFWPLRLATVPTSPSLTLPMCYYAESSVGISVLTSALEENITHGIKLKFPSTTNRLVSYNPINLDILLVYFLKNNQRL